MLTNCFSLLWSSVKSDFDQQTRICNIVAVKILQAISEIVERNMEPCRLKFHQVMLANIFKPQNEAIFHTGLKKFPDTRCYLDIDFALHCMDGMHFNALKFDVNVCE